MYCKGMRWHFQPEASVDASTSKFHPTASCSGANDGPVISINIPILASATLAASSRNSINPADTSGHVQQCAPIHLHSWSHYWTINISRASLGKSFPDFPPRKRDWSEIVCQQKVGNATGHKTICKLWIYWWQQASTEDK